MKIIINIFNLLLLTSCGRGLELTELYIQEITDSKLSVFQYGALSTLNDGAKYGFEIISKTESVSVVEAKQLPFNVFSDIPTKDTIFVIGHIDGGSTKTPQYHSTKIENYKGVVVLTDYYQYISNGVGTLTYKFSDFTETKDFIVISGIDESDFGSPPIKSELNIRKGNIKLIESDSIIGKLTQINIPAFFLKQYDNSPIDKQTIIGDNSAIANCLMNFEFIPTKAIKISDFTNVGIYKKRIIMNKTKLI